MTFIYGYIINETVHIMADSAETSINYNSIRKIEGRNSLGEIPYIDDKKVVKEGAQKIYNLKDKLLLTFAGNEKEGVSVVEEINYELDRPSMNYNIGDKLLHYFEGKSFSNHFIIGFYENNKPYLFFYHDKDHYKLANEKQVITSGGEDIPEIRTVLGRGLQQCVTWPDNYTLTALISMAQAQNISHLTLGKGVGGFFNGAYIGRNGIRWADDCFLILYSAKNYDKGEVFFSGRFNRGNAAFIICEAFKRVFINELDNIQFDKLIETWGNKLDNQINNGIAKFYVMISYDTGKVVIISDDFNKRNGLLKFQKEKNNIKLFIHPNLQQEMKTIRHQIIYKEGGCQAYTYF